jgi:2TM domain
MAQDPRIQAFLVHLAAYVVVTAICAAINLSLAPHYLWFVWVLVGWGIAIAAHGLALLLRKTHRRERIFIDPKARGFAVHLFAYAAVIVLLFIINLTITPKVWWFYWVALGWGLGIIAHGWCALRKRKPGTMTSPKEAGAEPKPAAKPKRQTAAPKTRTAPRKKPGSSRGSPKPQR